MDHRKQPKDSLSYSNLFNLESLMNFQVPRPDDDFDYYGNSSQDESRGSQDGAVGNGMMSDRELSSVKKRRRSQNSDYEDDDSYYGTRITEERYRSMLGEHIQKYKRRFKDSSSSPAPIQTGIPVPKSNKGLKSRKLGNEHRGGIYEMETSSEWLNDSNPQKPGNHHDGDLVPQRGTDRIIYEPPYLDIGDGITYRIPPIYDKLVSSLHLPSFSDFRVEEVYLRGTLDLGSLAEMMTSDKRLGPKNQAGMGDPHPQYESLQARLKASSTSNSAQKFSLKVSDIGLNSSIPEGAAGNIKRSILSEGGVLQVYYVKVLEKGDTYEIIERSLPKKQKVIKDPSVIEKEEMDKIGKVWVNIVRRDMPRHHRIFSNFHQRQLGYAKRVSENCQREVKLKVSRSLKLMRGAAIRTRKLARDMLLFWKRIDKEMAEVRKKEEKEAAEALRREQELREAKRQQQRLNFLIQQTELYSHFMQNKSSSQPSEDLPVGDGKKMEEKASLSSSDDEANEEEDPEEAELKKEAFKAAQDAVSKQKKITSEFDNEYLKLCEDAEPEAAHDVAGASSIDLHNPSTMPVTSTVQTPELFKGSLKEYQLKGLQWLVNCYEQGLNGILADEMGLGKTIQAMAFLAHLAEEKNIWGPFLVVAPASVLNNWADEISRFCPDLKTLPYWGGLNERQVLRKKITAKKLYRRDAGFHILITSYQLLVADEKYFKRVKWQYMVLDEAQAIKSSNSIRWKTLLGFNCRNRLLLTGTPIQNNMAELWALLHFIMPTLFDSHEQFNEWFSKGIENHAEHGGTLNEHQLNRLHSILKPFMLRRVKTDVVSELTRKTEVTVHCKLSSRQQDFYQAIKNKISLAELFDSNRGHLNEKKILNLMNIVIQLRKVCNHPELFERNEGSTYLYFSEIPNSLLAPPFGELEDVHYSGGQNPITYSIPKLFYQEILQSSETLCSAVQHGVYKESFEKYFNIFSPGNVYQSTLLQENSSSVGSGTFGFTRMMDLSPAEVAFLGTGSFMERLMFSIVRWDRQFLDGIVDSLMETMNNDSECSYLESGKVRAVTRMLLMPSRSVTNFLQKKLATGPGDDPFEALVVSHSDRLLSNTRLLHSAYTFIPRTRAPPVNAHCSDRNFAYKIIECFKRRSKNNRATMETSENAGVQQPQRRKDKHRKPKPWDDDPNIDRWTIEKFDPSWNEGGMLEVTSFSTLFPQYREKYLQECWPVVKSALKEYGITCELNLVEGSMTVSTTRKTKDPYIVVKARDLIKLLSRSVPAPQAIKILNDEMQCDIIKISSFVRSKERFVKRRDRLIGPNSSTLKALEILTGCYILVQGNTVSVMGSFKALKQVRRIVEDCMTNAMHPIFHIKTLMVRKELEKDPALANENWDRFLPKFKKKNINQNKVKSKEKRPYTPFPPPQQPSKIDIQLETGEYFLNDKVKSAKKWQEKQEKQSEKTAENKRKREAAFIPPKEPVVQDTKSDDGSKDLAAVATSLKKKAKEYGIQKMAENVNPEAYLAESGEPSKKKSKRKRS